MKKIELNEEQVLILRDLIETEIDYLETNAVEDALEKDKESIKKQLDLTKDILNKLA